MEQWADRPKVLLVDPASLSRSCTLVGLLSAMSVTAVPSLSDIPNDLTPDIVILQNVRTTTGKCTLSEQLKMVEEQWPQCATVVMADEGDASQILESLRNGAQALLTNNVSIEILIETLQMVWQGLAIYPSAALVLMRDAIKAADNSHRREDVLSDADFDHARFNGLTMRQQDVLRLLSIGLPNKAIAKDLNISESTVKVHIRAIMDQTGVHNRTQIITHFIMRGTDAHSTNPTAPDEQAPTHKGN